MSNEYDFKTITYWNEKSMMHGKEVMSQYGWEVVETITITGRYGCFNTACLGCLFLPLALLGRSKDKYQVTYKHKHVEIVNQVNQSQNTTVTRKAEKVESIIDKIMKAGNSLPELNQKQGLIILAVIIGTILTCCFCCLATGLLGSLMPKNPDVNAPISYPFVKDQIKN